MIHGSTVVPQTDYAGGLNAAENPLKIKDNESPDCLNAHTNVFGSVEKRKGKIKLNSVTVGATKRGNASLDYVVTTTSRKFLTVFDNTLYKMDDLDGTWDALTMTVTIGSGRAELRQYLTKAVLASHVSGNVQSWDGSSGAMATISGSAAFKYLGVDDISGRLWAAGLASNDGVGYFTPVNALSFDTTNDKLVISNTDVIVGFRQLKGRFYALGRNNIYRIDDLGGDPRFGARPVAHPGTLSPESAQVGDLLGIGEGILYLGTDKQLYFFNGTDTARLSYKFDHRSTISSAQTLDQISAAYLDEVHAVVNPLRNWYMLHYPSGSDVINNNCMVYDLNSQSAWPFNGMPANTAALVNDGNNALRIYQTGYTGFTWQFDSGNDDDGSAINSYYDFSRKPSQEDARRRGLLHKWRQIALAMKATGAYTVTLQVRMEFATGYTTLKAVSLAGTGAQLGSFVLGTDVLGGQEGILDMIGVDRLGKFCQFRIQDNSSNPAWQLFGDEVTARPVGVY